MSTHTADGLGATANMTAMENIRWAVRQAQLDLIRNPNPDDPWWFLVDPHAAITEPEPT